MKIGRNFPVCATIGCVLYVLCAIPASFAAGKPATPPTAKGYAAFRLVQSLNVFDPDRRPLPGPGNAAKSPTRSEGPATAATIVLTGTMISGSRSLAFFTGSDPAYNKVLSAKEKIAGFSITSISSTHVDLERDGKAVSLAVGKKLSMDGVITAQAVTAPVVAEQKPGPRNVQPGAANPPSPAPETDEASESPKPPAAPPSDAGDILRRMMERRDKELSK